MAEQKERNIDTSISQGKNRVGDGSLCAGNVTGEIFKRRLRQLSGISLEMRRK